MTIEINGQTIDFDDPNAELREILNKWIYEVWAEYPELSRHAAQCVAMNALREEALKLKHDKDDHAS